MRRDRTSTERLIDVAKLGRIAARSPAARARHGATRRRHAGGGGMESIRPTWMAEREGFQ